MVLVQRTLFAAWMVVFSFNNMALAQSLNGELAADVCRNETEALRGDQDVAYAQAVLESELQLTSNYEVVNCTARIMDAIPGNDVPLSCEVQLVGTKNSVQAFETACESKGGQVHTHGFHYGCGDIEAAYETRTHMQFVFPGCAGVSCNVTEARVEFEDETGLVRVLRDVFRDACSRSSAPSGKSVVGAFFLSATLLYLF